MSQVIWYYKIGDELINVNRSSRRFPIFNNTSLLNVDRSTKRLTFSTIPISSMLKVPAKVFLLSKIPCFVFLISCTSSIVCQIGNISIGTSAIANNLLIIHCQGCNDMMQGAPADHNDYTVGF